MYRVFLAWVVALCLLSGLSAATVAAENLVPNGDFSHSQDPLHGWKTVYRGEADRNYFNNHRNIAVVDEPGRGKVVRMRGDHMLITQSAIGIKMESSPVPFDPEATYRFTIDARTEGPNARIYLQGFRWRPRLERHDNPTLADLARNYRFGPINFQGDREERFSNPPRTWGTATQIISSDGLSDLARRHYEQIDFLVVYVMAVGGGGGTLYVDRVHIEKVDPQP